MGGMARNEVVNCLLTTTNRAKDSDNDGGRGNIMCGRNEQSDQSDPRSSLLDAEQQLTNDTDSRLKRTDNAKQICRHEKPGVRIDDD